MPETKRETTIQLHGNASMVAELFDNWEGMDLISVRFGAHDGDGGISWSGEAIAIDTDMARSLAGALIDLADAKEFGHGKASS